MNINKRGLNGRFKLICQYMANCNDKGLLHEQIFTQRFDV